MSVTIAETRDIATCRRLRRTVFIEEQGVSEADEIDDLDDLAIHLLATNGGKALGSARVIVQTSTGKIGRVCVVPQERGKGIGAALIRAAVDRLRHTPGVTQAKLGAQTHAIAFYEALGFTAVGDVFLDAGIDHQEMILSL